MLGLAVNLPSSIRTTILCFRDHASCVPFLDQLERAGIAARMLSHANPHFAGMISDVVAVLRGQKADLLICHGYKADVLGWLAARRAGIPVLSVSRGWTAHTRKVRCYEALDRRMLRLMDGVVCVSEAQAAKVRRAGVRPDRLWVIHNAIDSSRFRDEQDGARAVLKSLFPEPRDHIVIGVGRLSPEKGFDRFVEAAALVAPQCRTAGFVVVGDGPDRGALEQRVRDSALEGHVAFTGFRSDIDRLLPGADVLAQSSYTEGLPNVILEACAAGIPVVATDVGGTREVVHDGLNGFLVPSGDPKALATRLLELLRSPSQRHAMGAHGREFVRHRFSFADQSARYSSLFDLMTKSESARRVAARSN